MLESTSAIARLMVDARCSPRALAPRISERLRRVLIAAKSVPHYRERMEQAGYDPLRDFNGASDLSSLPITLKSDLKAAPESFVQQDCGPLNAYFSDHTSGSTGMPLTVYRSHPERTVQIAKWLRVLMLSGYRPTDKVLSFTSPARLSHGRSMLQRVGLFRRQAVDFHLSPETCVDLLTRYRPDVVYGVRTSLLTIAKELERRGILVPSIKLLVGGGEVIDAHTRRRCRQVFGIDITETYGSIEMGVMAYQRRGENSLKLIEDCTYFEFLDEQGQPAKPGQLARIVVTDLHGRLMPFIRYDQGDLAIYSVRQNAQGETVRVIDRIVGRQDDVAPLPDGRVLTYLDFYDIIYAYPEVKGFRITQFASIGFTVEIAASLVYYRRIHGQLLSQLQELSGLPLRFDLRAVERIDPDPSGKRRVLVSEVVNENAGNESG